MKEYRQEKYLYEKYWEEEMSSREIAEEQNVDKGTILNWMKRKGVPRRKPNNEKPGHFRIDNKGYARFYVGDEYIYMHRLLAVAKYGFKYVKRKVVHHKNGVKWDNRYENIELMSNQEHSILHNG